MKIPQLPSFQETQACSRNFTYSREYGGVEAIRHEADPGADRLLGKALGLNTENI